jgi:ribosomal protein S27AE
MFDKTATMIVDYQKEVAARHMLEWFERHALECPNCGNKVIIPPHDYICGACRMEASLLR